MTLTPKQCQMSPGAAALNRNMIGCRWSERERAAIGSFMVALIGAIQAGHTENTAMA
jgi:hypothetical protein